MFRASTLLPSLVEFKSKSSNRFPKSSSLSVPIVLCSMLLSITSRSSIIEFVLLAIELNNSEGFKKYPKEDNASLRIASIYLLPSDEFSSISLYFMPSSISRLFA